MSNSQKEILMLCPEQRPKIGGLADYSAILSGLLQKKGYRVRNIAHKNIFSWDNIPDRAIVNLQYVPHMYSRHGVPFLLLFDMIWLKFFHRIRLISTIHEKYITLSRSYSWSILQYAYYSIISLGERIIYLCLIAVSDSVIIYEEGLSKWIKKIKLSSIPSNFEFVADGKSHHAKNYITKKAYRSKPGNMPKAFLISAFSGDKKCISMLISCISEIDGVDLCFVGKVNSSLKNAIEKQSSNLGIAVRVRFTGIIPAEKLKSIIAGSDIFFHRYGGIDACMKSGSLACAMQCGLPIICFNNSSHDGNTFGLFDRKNIIFCNSKSSLKDSILLLINDAKLRKSLGINAGKYYRMNRSWASVIDTYDKILRQMLKKTEGV